MKAFSILGWNFRSVRAMTMWSHNSSASHAARLLNRPYFVQPHTHSSGFKSGTYPGKSSTTISGLSAKNAWTRRDLLWMTCRSHTTVNGRSYQNLDAFAPAAEWETLPCPVIDPSGDRRDADGL